MVPLSQLPFPVVEGFQRAGWKPVYRKLVTPFFSCSDSPYISNFRNTFCQEITAPGPGGLVLAGELFDNCNNGFLAGSEPLLCRWLQASYWGVCRLCVVFQNFSPRDCRRNRQNDSHSVCFIAGFRNMSRNDPQVPAACPSCLEGRGSFQSQLAQIARSNYLFFATSSVAGWGSAINDI